MMNIIVFRKHATAVINFAGVGNSTRKRVNEHKFNEITGFPISTKIYFLCDNRALRHCLRYDEAQYFIIIIRVLRFCAS